MHRFLKKQEDNKIFKDWQLIPPCKFFYQKLIRLSCLITSKTEVKGILKKGY